MTAYGSLPFEEAIAFFRDKLNLPTERWDDIRESAHDRAFVVAGAMQADLLADLRAAVDKAIAQGGTLAEFRKDFEALVQKHGWTGWTGEGSAAGRAWRTKVIYATNLRTSHAAGRYAQMQAIKARRPYWRYNHNDTVLHPREDHLAWDGTILPADDPWWQTHFPPNGWGCRCWLDTLAQRDLDKLGIDPQTLIAPTGVDDPTGIDTGWGYAPGANAQTPLRELIDRKLFNLEAPIGAALWEALGPVLMAETVTRYRAWLARLATDARAKSEAPVIGALASADLSWLAASGSPLPASAEIAITNSVINGPKALRHAAKGDALAAQIIDNLPELLAIPIAVLYDAAKGTLLYILPEASARRPQLVVELDYQRKDRRNVIVSAYRASVVDLQDRIARGDVLVVRGEFGG